MILEEIFHGRYSKSTIKKITDVVKEEIDTWQSRPLRGILLFPKRRLQRNRISQFFLEGKKVIKK